MAKDNKNSTKYDCAQENFAEATPDIVSCDVNITETTSDKICSININKAVMSKTKNAINNTEPSNANRNSKHIGKYALFFINSLEGGGAETVVKTLAWELNNQGIKSVFVTLYNSLSNTAGNNTKHYAENAANNSTKSNAESTTKKDAKCNTESFVENNAAYVTTNSTINTYPDYIRVHCMNLTPPNSAIESVYYMQNIEKILNKIQEWKVFLATFKNIKFSLVTAHLPLSHKVCSLTSWGNEAIYVMHSSQHMVPKAFRYVHGKIIYSFYKNKKVSCVSNGVRDELINKYGFNPNYTKTIYNPVRNLHVKNALKRSKPYILMIGRLCKEKRQDIAIKLFIKGNFYKTHDLIILGEGPCRQKLEDIAYKHPEANDSIYLLGHKSNIADWLAGASMLLSTSATEGLPMNLIEALSLKTPVVSTDCNYGPNEILTDELAIYLIPKVGILQKSKYAQQKSVNIIKRVLDDYYPKITETYINKFVPKNIVAKYLDFYSKNNQNFDVNSTNKSDIPKIIHYCWFGNKKMSKLEKKCIQSWKKFCPDYKIIKWSEGNFDINMSQYTKGAYKNKKWAFVSDYCRYYAIKKYGGIYFDTDVELIKPINSIINKGCFFAFENGKHNKINPGLGFALNKNNNIAKNILNVYNKQKFINKTGNEYPMTVCDYTTNYLKTKGLKQNGKIQSDDNLTIYPREYFDPLNRETNKINITKNTISIHHYAGSWQSPYQRFACWFLPVSNKILGHKITEFLQKQFGSKRKWTT